MTDFILAPPETSLSPRKGKLVEDPKFGLVSQVGYAKRDAKGKDWDSYKPVLKVKEEETNRPSPQAAKAPAAGKKLPALGKTAGPKAYISKPVGLGMVPRSVSSRPSPSQPPSKSHEDEVELPEGPSGQRSRRNSEPIGASPSHAHVVDAWGPEGSPTQIPAHDVASILQNSTRIVMFPGQTASEAYAQIKAPGGTLTVPLNLNEEPQSLREAYENRMFLPALPEQWQRRTGVGGTFAESGKKIVELSKEVSNVRNRAELEIQARDAEISRLVQQLRMQKELMARQTEAHQLVARELHALKENKKKEMAEMMKKTSDGDKRVHQLQRRLGEVAAEQDRALTEAAHAIEAIKRERHVLASALAAVSMSAVGGEDVDATILAAEADVAIQEGSDPLPRLPVSWLRFSYVDGPALPPHQAKPGRVTELYGKASRAKPLGGDGARAVAALVAHVARLHRQREEAREGEHEALQQVRSLTEVVSKVDVEYQLIRDAVEVMERELSRISAVRQYRGLGLEITGQGTLAARIRTLTNVVGRMALELEYSDEEKQRLNAHVLELGFYSKLHGKLIEEAKVKVKQGTIQTREPEDVEGAEPPQEPPQEEEPEDSLVSSDPPPAPAPAPTESPTKPPSARTRAAPPQPPPYEPPPPADSVPHATLYSHVDERRPPASHVDDASVAYGSVDFSYAAAYPAYPPPTAAADRESGSQYSPARAHYERSPSLAPEGAERGTPEASPVELAPAQDPEPEPPSPAAEREPAAPAPPSTSDLTFEAPREAADIAEPPLEASGSGATATATSAARDLSAAAVPRSARPSSNLMNEASGASTTIDGMLSQMVHGVETGADSRRASVMQPTLVEERSASGAEVDHAYGAGPLTVEPSGHTAAIDGVLSQMMNGMEAGGDSRMFSPMAATTGWPDTARMNTEEGATTHEQETSLSEGKEEGDVF